MPERDVADYFSEKLILKRSLGDLKEWSGEFDVEEGDSDWYSNIKIRFRLVSDNQTKKQHWVASGAIVDGWEFQKTPFKDIPVMLLDEDGSAFFKIGKKRCYLFRHKTRGRILIVESGFYEQVKDTHG